ncbi:interleukin-17 receptor C [Pelodytes ibericus]
MSPQGKINNPGYLLNRPKTGGLLPNATEESQTPARNTRTRKEVVLVTPQKVDPYMAGLSESNLSCMLSPDSWCLPGGLEEVTHPILVPENIRSQTVMRCEKDNCFPCVQVEVDMFATFLTDTDVALGSGGSDCDDYEYADDGDTEEGDVTSLHNLNVSPWNDGKGLNLCANLFISYVMSGTSYCVALKVWMPLSSEPRTLNGDRVIVGKVVFNCFNASPDGDMNLTLYTVPRYRDVLSIMHHLPGCKILPLMREVKQCEEPTIQLSINENVSVSILNGSAERTVKLELVHNTTTVTAVSMKGDKRYILSKEDVVPCLCFQASWEDLMDARRGKVCPFLQRVSDNPQPGHSPISLRPEAEAVSVEANGRLLLMVLEAGAVTMGTSGMLLLTVLDAGAVSMEANGILLLTVLDAGAVRSKGRIRHTKCLPVPGKLFIADYVMDLTESHNSAHSDEFLVLVSRVPDGNTTSLCLLETHNCTHLHHSARHVLSGDDSFKQKIVEKFRSDQCMKIWSKGENAEVFVCFVERRHRWITYFVISVSCILILLILKNKPLREWVRSITSDRSFGEIFQDRRVLILYSPDNPTYKDLVQVLATSLMDLQLKVILDEWHRVEMCEVNPIPWYHRQKTLVFEQKGMIVLLLNEDAKEKFLRWNNGTPHSQTYSDPYASFGAVLNCVQPDFLDGTAAGHYVVATFGQVDIPKVFQAVPVYTLPLEMKKLLRELAGSKRAELRRKQLCRISAELNNKLQKPLEKYNGNRTPPAMSRISGSETVFMDSNGALRRNRIFSFFATLVKVGDFGVVIGCHSHKWTLEKPAPLSVFVTLDGVGFHGDAV